MRSRRFNSLRACFSTSSGMFASAIAFSSSAISAAPSSSSPSSFWIVRICSRSRCLRLAMSIDSLRALVDFARNLEHLDAVREQLEQLVEPRLEVERLQQRLLLLGARRPSVRTMKSASRAGPSTPCSATTISSGTCGSSCRISIARCFRLMRARFDLGIDRVDLLDALHPRDRET